MYMLQGMQSVTNFITAYEESQYNQDFHFLIFVSKGNIFDSYYGKCCALAHIVLIHIASKEGVSIVFLFFKKKKKKKKKKKINK